MRSHKPMEYDGKHGGKIARKERKMKRRRRRRTRERERDKGKRKG